MLVAVCQLMSGRCTLLYADDVVLLANDEQALQQMIDIVDQFCRDWQLDINLDKG